MGLAKIGLNSEVVLISSGLNSEILLYLQRLQSGTVLSNYLCVSKLIMTTAQNFY